MENGKIINRHISNHIFQFQQILYR